MLIFRDFWSTLRSVAPMHEHTAFTTTVELAEDSSSVRNARVIDLCIHGCYLVMPDPFPMGTPVLVKIRTPVEFFECRAEVARYAAGLGMGVDFRRASPPFQIVLQEWLSRRVCLQIRK
jgi:hypothetical protein